MTYQFGLFREFYPFGKAQHIDADLYRYHGYLAALRRSRFANLLLTRQNSSVEFLFLYSLSLSFSAPSTDTHAAATGICVQFRERVFRPTLAPLFAVYFSFVKPLP